MLPRIEVLVEGHLDGQGAQLAGFLLKNVLDMMVLRTLVTEVAHGHTITKVMEQTSEDILEVDQGSMYPACIAWKTATG